MCLFVLFFFKQKTAYEMRISDWSSDVCSSDLRVFISLGVPEGAKVTDEELITLRESMASMLRSIDVEAQILDPVGLLKLVDDLTSPTTVSGEDVVDYNRFDPIADQAVRRDMEIVTHPYRILIRTERFLSTGRLQEQRKRRRLKSSHNC